MKLIEIIVFINFQVHQPQLIAFCVDLYVFLGIFEQSCFQDHLSYHSKVHIIYEFTQLVHLIQHFVTLMRWLIF